MEILKHKKYFSIKTKITISIVFFVLTVIGIVFSVSFVNARKIMREDLRLRMLNMVNIAVLHIDTKKHATLIEAKDESSQNYKDIKKDLQDVRNQSTDISYIYTLRENENNQITFVVDAEENLEDVSHLGDVYSDANQFLLDNFLTINSAVVEKEFTSDRWGTWISSYAPFYDGYGKRIGVLGIDVSASDIVRLEDKMFYNYLLYFSISGVLSIFLGLYLSRILTKSISILTSIIKNTNPDVQISNDEIGEFAGVLKTTLDEINTTQKNTEEKVSDKTKMLEKMNKLMIGRELEMIKLKKEVAGLKKAHGLTKEEQNINN